VKKLNNSTQNCKSIDDFDRKLTVSKDWADGIEPNITEDIRLLNPPNQV
jgi:hypothetical protein